MSRPIDADALIEFIDNRYHITWEDGYEGGIKDACVDIIKEINKMPTIKRKTGKWIDNETSYADGVRQTCTCSICGQRSVRPLGRFCRWCGADMGGDKDDQR